MFKKNHQEETKRQKQIKHIIHRVSLITLLISFASLVIIGITSVAYSLKAIPLNHQNGVPEQWASLVDPASPNSITMPVAYFDQRQDPCRDAVGSRQFEYAGCGGNYSYGLQQGLVQNTLGADGLPVPTYKSAAESKSANVQTVSQGVTGGNPAQSGDNFYRWFHEVDGKSQKINKEISFKKVGDNSYQYGGSNIFPLDGNAFSKGDVSSGGHNFGFTMHLRVPFRVLTTGSERFDFQGDDDVWVFVNGQLILDIGGVHGAIDGYFIINQDGTISATVDGKTKTINANIKKGDIVNLDFFYAERSITEANCKITISGMRWPISATPKLAAELAGPDLIQYDTSLSNNDPAHNLDVVGLASYFNDGEAFNENGLGYLPLDIENLAYSFSPSDPNSWQKLNVSAPTNETDGFVLTDKLALAPTGQSGDTVYFRYFVRPNNPTGSLFNTVTFKTNFAGAENVVSDAAPIAYVGAPTDDVAPPEESPTETATATETESPSPSPAETSPTSEPSESPSESESPSPSPTDDTIADNLDDGRLDPLGEIEVIPVADAVNKTYPYGAPNTGLGHAPKSDSGVSDFAAIVLSQGFLLANLGVFALSFTAFYLVKGY